MSKQIPLTRGKVTIVDDADFPMLSGLPWHAVPLGGTWYAHHTERVAGQSHSTPMHRMILDAPATRQVDHKNGDGLDNRRANLRVCTRSQNRWNSHATSCGGSRFCGVYSDSGRWRARIQCNGVRTSIGYFARDRRRYSLRCEVPSASRTVRPAEFLYRGIPEKTAGMGLPDGRAFFTVSFINRTDGSERIMRCRTGVAPLPGSSTIQITHSHDLLSVWDIANRQFRYIPLEGILWVRMKSTFIRPSYASRCAMRPATTQGLLSAQTAGS